MRKGHRLGAAVTHNKIAFGCPSASGTQIQTYICKIIKKNPNPCQSK